MEIEKVVEMFKTEIVDWLKSDNENAEYIAWKLVFIAQQRVNNLNISDVTESVCEACNSKHDVKPMMLCVLCRDFVK